ncbi:hypothetical protein SAMN05880501_12316 [Ureibacillus xyleni]|uniref:Uncharacterized protein n=1 Tax=Ureibacillus xyleni TaxID=614648 RepID=A0A285TU67_9BACL|nr:hypothetical protein [Ureibacillus xyleni]SOC27551.1 hypothetical protein SAMN05880501_12316 [Ureibacillus xyleni]
MNAAISEIIHKQIILDLTIRTLERERKHLDDLKMKNAFELWMEAKIKELQQDLRAVKYELGKLGVKVQSEKWDSTFTEYTILERGAVYQKRYSNIALRNWTDEEVKRLLGLEHRTVESGNTKVTR